MVQVCASSDGGATSMRYPPMHVLLNPSLPLLSLRFPPYALFCLFCYLFIFGAVALFLPFSVYVILSIVDLIPLLTVLPLNRHRVLPPPLDIALV